ncbi:TMEM43 family protein [Oscillochloris sp. ZM17-4]|uniref:TMEM43 family protein n=1 Tax=Oscillochloris sp. ZM17-4 TaxID=2866714 RepID=UPI001C72B3BA|nr:TMEM43 family protein [Oscillochloris sp. ZM17-4]MBX0328967.1 TMEM43 family protein [Oscillochloris sp. ZM17-4]
MYAWVEHEESKTRDEPGGGTRTETTYTYRKEWTASPQSGASFEYPNGHRNPAMEFTSDTMTAANGSIGAYELDMASLDLPSAEDLQLNSSIVAPTSNVRQEDNYLLIGRSSLSDPQIGHVRISYKALPAGQSFTTFGMQRGGQIIAYSNEKGDRLYRALEGDRAAAINQLQVEDTIMDWVIRIGTLLMMWAGLSMALGPLNAAVGILPVIRQAGGCLIGLVTLAVAFPIWGATVLIAIVAHNIWLMIGVALLIMGGAFVFLRRRQALA